MLKAIALGGLACGVCDIVAAFVVYGALFHAKPLGILRGIASGALGTAAFSGGLPAAALGLVFEFAISLGATAAYVVASRRLPVLLDRPIPAGALYGIFVYYFMDKIVVPLSQAPHPPAALRGILIGLAIHILFVGLPIALVARRVLRGA